MTIPHVTLGRTAPLTVSALGLGCMGMSEFYGTPDEEGLPYSPLGRGLLTGAITEEPSGAGESRATAYFPRFQGKNLATNLALVERIRSLADAKGCTPGQLALAWVVAQGSADLGVAPIPGTKRVRYLEENVGSLAVGLTADDLIALEDAVPRDAVAGDRYGDMSTIDA